MVPMVNCILRKQWASIFFIYLGNEVRTGRNKGTGIIVTGGNSFMLERVLLVRAERLTDNRECRAGYT